MLEDTAMALLLDVLEILTCLPARGILLAHVTKPPGKLGELLAVGTLSKPVDRKVRRLRE